jgi:hypothetical protein
VVRTVGLRTTGTAGSRHARGWPIAACFIDGQGERAFTVTGHPGLNSQYGEQPRPERAQGTHDRPVNKARRVRDGADHEASRDARHWEGARRPWEGTRGERTPR